MLMPSLTWESLCMARAEGVRESQLPAQYSPAGEKIHGEKRRDEKKPPLHHKLTIQV